MSRPKRGSFPRSEDYSRHSENLRAIRATWRQLDRLHKAAIRRNAQPEIHALAECQYLYLGIEAEARLRKTLFDPTGFTEAQRQLVLGEKTQIDRWLRAVKVAFGIRYHKAAVVEFDRKLLDSVAQHRYDQIASILNSELRPVIENRNKIAHAQSVWQLKSMSDGNFKAGSTRIDFGDYWDLKNLRNALEAIGEIVLTLVVSLPTFERDFDSHYTRLTLARANIDANLNGSEYQKFALELARTIVRTGAAD